MKSGSLKYYRVCIICGAARLKLMNIVDSLLVWGCDSVQVRLPSIVEVAVGSPEFLQRDHAQGQRLRASRVVREPFVDPRLSQVEADGAVLRNKRIIKVSDATEIGRASCRERV